MSSEIELGLEGEVTIEDFSVAMQGFQALIRDLATEVAPTANVEWVVAALRASSATATLEALPAPGDEEHARRIAQAYGEVGKALERGEAVPFVAQSRGLRQVLGVLGERVDNLTFVSNGESAVVRAASPDLVPPKTFEALGAVTGRLETLQGHAGFKITVYDAREGHAVRCHLTEEQAELSRTLWRRMVTVEGLVKREVDSGRPVSVSFLTAISPSEGAGNWRDAAGAAPRQEGAPSAEEAIGRVRDA